MKPTLRLNGVLWPATATAVALVSVLILDSTDRATARLDAAAAAVHPAELVRAAGDDSPHDPVEPCAWRVRRRPIRPQPRPRVAARGARR